VRDYIHVEDTLSAFQSVINTGRRHRIYNIGSGVGTSTGEILAEFENHFDLRKKIHYGPRRLVDVERSILDISRAREELNWRPHIKIKEGIEKVVYDENDTNPLLEL
jgi:UDP-glucose 4-epimerase